MKLDKRQKLQLSPYMRIIKGEHNAVIWHSLFGLPKVISFEVIELLNLFKKPKTIESVKKCYKFDIEIDILFLELFESYYLINSSNDEREALKDINQKREKHIYGGKMVDYLELIVSEKCNFNCSYCIHFTNLSFSDRFKERSLMSFETAKIAIDKYFESLRLYGKRNSVINFGGGEPLLNWRIVKKCLEYVMKKYNDEYNVKYILNTNASLLTEEIAKKLAIYKVEVVSSLDGLGFINNLVRKTTLGEDTFSLILSGFDNMAKTGNSMRGIAMTIGDANYPYLGVDIIDWAHKRKMLEVRIDIDVLGMTKIPTEEIGLKLMELRRYGYKRNIKVFGFWSRPFENLSLSNLNEAVSFCGGAKGCSICVNQAGKIYYCGYSSKAVGDIINFDKMFVAQSEYSKFIIDKQVGCQEFCINCEIEGQCVGGCQITWEHSVSSGQKTIERMCNFYKHMTKQLLIEQINNIY